MRSIYFFSVAILLSSCGFIPPAKVDEKVLEEKVGKATNYDILKYMKEHRKPVKIVLSDNKKYWYRYPDDIVFVFENDTLCGGSFKNFKNLKVKGKYQCKHKEWDDTLSNDWIDSRYRYLELPTDATIDLKKITADEFLRKITPGMKKVEIFRLIGKPNYSYDDKGEERWRYNIDKPYYSKQAEGFLGIGGTKLRYAGRVTLRDFVIVFKNNAVIDRYVAMEAEMTEEEKRYMKKGILSFIP